MTKFAESAKTSVSQQTFAILVASLFRHWLLHCMTLYFRAPCTHPPKMGAHFTCICLWAPRTLVTPLARAFHQSAAAAADHGSRPNGKITLLAGLWQSYASCLSFFTGAWFRLRAKYFISCWRSACVPTDCQIAHEVEKSTLCGQEECAVRFVCCRMLNHSMRSRASVVLASQP